MRGLAALPGPGSAPMIAGGLRDLRAGVVVPPPGAPVNPAPVPRAQSSARNQSGIGIDLRVVWSVHTVVAPPSA